MPHFDVIAQHYNTMTGYPGRIDRLVEMIGPWVKEWGTKTALDAGCGNGCLMFALQRLHVDAIGIDAAEGMVRLTLDNARALGVSVDVRGSTYEAAGNQFPERFDTVFSLGNALVGAASHREMVHWLVGLRDALRPGGHLLIQMLNLTPFLNGQKTLISRRQVNDVVYTRFAQRAGATRNDGLTFGLTVAGPGEEFFAHTGHWYPWDRSAVLACLADAGFGGIEVFGSLTKSEYDDESAVDLVIAASRRTS